MQCPFCHANNASNLRACHFCGGPLGGLNPSFPPTQPQRVGPPAASPRFAAPIAPILSIEEAPPAKPVLIPSQAREKSAPRIVAVLFWPRDEDVLPLLVLENGDLQGWDLGRDAWHRLAPRRTLRNPGLTTCAVFSPECEVVATGHDSGQVRLQRLEFSGERAAMRSGALGVVEAHRGCVLALGVAKTRLYSAGSDGAVVLTNLSGAPDVRGIAECEPQVVLDGMGALSCLAVSPDGRWLALGADDGAVQMWRLGEDGASARLDWTVREDRLRVKSLAFSPNGNMLISRHAQNLCLWATQTGHRLQRMAQPNALISPAFAPDSRLLAYANASGGLSLCDAWTGAPFNTLAPVGGDVQALGFSPVAETQARETLLIVAGAQQILAWKVSF